MIRIFLLCVLALAHVPCHAFGPLGHQTVAEIASRHLDPQARLAVEHLLGDAAAPAMREASTWADEIKARQDGPRTGSLHFVNLDPATCRYNAKRDCPGGHCIVAALTYFAEQLRAAPTMSERADALRWVIHLVADIAQPLHAYGADRGGNLLQARIGARGTNLHQIWDSVLLDASHLDSLALADHLERRSQTTLPPATIAWNPSAPVSWAEESCRAMTADAYRGGEIDASYVRRFGPVDEQQVKLAGYRLAALLNAVLAWGS